MEVITYNFTYHDQLANSCKASEAFHQRTFVQVAKSFLFKVNIIFIFLRVNKNKPQLIVAYIRQLPNEHAISHLELSQ